MIRFILGLYILAANGIAIPDAVWVISWITLAYAGWLEYGKRRKNGGF